MHSKNIFKAVIAATFALSLASCGGAGSLGRIGPAATNPDAKQIGDGEFTGREGVGGPNRTTVWDLFKRKDTGNTVRVNRYLWNASLDVLNFLPIQSIDPFTGVIVTGYGTPPGGGRAYRATVYIKDPALDARSLNVAIATRSGPVAAGTQRAVENAILARARQLRIADKKF